LHPPKSASSGPRPRLRGGMARSNSAPVGDGFFLVNSNSSSNNHYRHHRQSSHHWEKDEEATNGSVASIFRQSPLVMKNASYKIQALFGSDSLKDSGLRRRNKSSLDDDDGGYDNDGSGSLEKNSTAHVVYADEGGAYELVAVKIFQKSVLKRKRTMERNKETGRMQVRTALEKVEREVALMKKLAHPNLVRFFEAIDSPESDMLFMVRYIM
jgi:serine/threonine protein kinase